MVRPKKFTGEDETTKRIGVDISDKMDKQIEAYCKANNIPSRTDFYRYAISKTLNDNIMVSNFSQITLPFDFKSGSRPFDNDLYDGLDLYNHVLIARSILSRAIEESSIEVKRIRVDGNIYTLNQFINQTFTLVANFDKDKFSFQKKKKLDEIIQLRRAAIQRLYNFMKTENENLSHMPEYVKWMKTTSEWLDPSKPTPDNSPIVDL